MKKMLLTLLPLAIAGSTSIAQIKPFYYADGKRMYLNADTTAIFVKFKDLEAKVPFAQTVHATGVVSTEKTRYPSVQKIHLDPDSKASAMAAIRSNSSIAYSWQALTAGDNEPIIPTGEIIVMPQPGGPDVETLVKKLALDVVIKEKDPLLDGAVALIVPDDANLFDFANRLYESGEVKYATPNFWMHFSNDAPNDPLYGQQNWLNNTVNPLIDINVEDTWPLTTNIVKIAVMDDGIAAHPDFPAGALQPGWAPRNPSGGGLPNYSRTGVGHGQSVAGIIAAKANNNTGIAGAYQGPCQLYSINIFWDGLETAQDIANAFNYARNNLNVDVINGSWSYSPGANFDNLNTAIDNAAIHGRGGKGINIIQSSGNDITASNLVVRYPATRSTVTAVGAIDDNGVVTFFSCRGPELDVVALGQVSSVLTTDLPGAPGDNPGDYRWFGGTSAAAPMVAAIAAGAISISPNASGIYIRGSLTSGTRDLGPWFFDNDYGWGLVNGCAALASAVAVQSGITGPQYVGTMGGHFAVTNLPANLPLTVEWLHTGSAQYTLTPTSPNGSTCVIVPTTNGQITLSAHIRGVCDVAQWILFLPTIYTVVPLSAPIERYIISPVPASQHLTVKINEENGKSESDIREVSLFDKTGLLKVVRRFPAGQRTVTIDISHLPADIYVVKVDDENKSTEIFAKQIVISR